MNNNFLGIDSGQPSSDPQKTMAWFLKDLDRQLVNGNPKGRTSCLLGFFNCFTGIDWHLNSFLCIEFFYNIVPFSLKNKRKKGCDISPSI